MPVYKLYIDVIKGSAHQDDIKVDNSNFMKAIWTILLADFTMSLDNVLGVAGAAGDHYALLAFGLIWWFDNKLTSVTASVHARSNLQLM